jgi:hypothetical protein
MWHRSKLVAGCFGGAVAVASVLIGLEVSATSAASAVERGTPAVHRTFPMVNRSLKSDRMPLVPSDSRNTLNGPAGIKAPPITKPVLLIGCEPVVSAIGQPPLSKVAGRCIS